MSSLSEPIVTQSQTLFKQAQYYIPGGVNSPVRSFQGVGSTPRFIQSAQGAYLNDVDNHRYIDYVGSFGPMILGHAHPSVVCAIQDTLMQGLSFGAPCELEILLAKKICTHMPSIKKIRMVNSGTEATMSAIRLARGFTDRTKILKFEGCYHGHADSLLVKAGSGALTLGIPSSSGVTLGAAQDTLTATFNDLNSVTELFEAFGNDIAAIIVEPIAGNMSTVMPNPNFLQGLREICDHYASVLIFDEVITGFRVGLGGAQHLYQVFPDLTTLGKIIGGGLPIGAFGGREDIMNHLAPLGSVYQAGTLSGNPIAMAAGLATLQKLETPHFYSRLAEKTQYLAEGIVTHARSLHVPLAVNYACGIFGLFFTDEPHVNTYAHVMACNTEQFKRFFHSMLQHNIYMAPSAFESGFISAAHGDTEINQTLAAVKEALLN